MQPQQFNGGDNQRQGEGHAPPGEGTSSHTLGFNLARDKDATEPHNKNHGRFRKMLARAYIYFDSNDKSFWLLSPNNLLRRCLLAITSHWLYRAGLMFLVLTNLAYLAVEDPKCDAECKASQPDKQLALHVIDLFYAIAFTVDVVAQALALNMLLGPGAYLKDGWNWIDLLATATGWIQFMPVGTQINNLVAIRALRACLRPLRALKQIPGLKRLVNTLLLALPLLLDVLLMLCWIFAVFGIIALQLFQGMFRGRCVQPGGLDMAAALVNATASLAAPPTLLPPMPLDVSAPTGLNTSNSSKEAVAGMSDASVLSQGLTQAGLQIAAGWEDQPCALVDPGLGHCPDGFECQRTDQNPGFGYVHFDNFGSTSFVIFQALTLDKWSSNVAYPLMNSVGPIPTLIFTTLLLMVGSYFAMQLLIAVLSSKFAQIRSLSSKPRRRGRVSAQQDLTRHATVDLDHVHAQERAALRGSLFSTWRLRARHAWQKLRRHLHNARVRIHETLLCPTPCHDMSKFRLWVFGICHAPWFHHTSTLLVITNTLILGMQYAGQPEAYTKALDIVNQVLAAGFAIEFIIKHVGLGYVRYWRDPWNILDGLIVLISIADLVITVLASSSGASKLQALRTFRVLRVARSLRLLARVPSLRRLMTLVLKGFVALKDFFVLLTLFVYIFGILGYQLFAGEEAFSCKVSPGYCRANFDTLWESMYTAFQILTLDDWAAIASNGMQARGHAASVYFILWVVLGNFVLLTLFLAILISTFKDEPVLTQEELESQLLREARQERGEMSMYSSDGTSRNASSTDSNGNAFAHRVFERVGQRLELSEVHKMKKWLVMMGVEHGLTQQETEEIQVQLDAAYQLAPQHFNPGFDYLQADAHAARDVLELNARVSTLTIKGLHLANEPHPGGEVGSHRSSALKRMAAWLKKDPFPGISRAADDTAATSTWRHGHDVEARKAHRVSDPGHTTEIGPANGFAGAAGTQVLNNKLQSFKFAAGTAQQKLLGKLKVLPASAPAVHQMEKAEAVAGQPKKLALQQEQVLSILQRNGSIHDLVANQAPVSFFETASPRQLQSTKSLGAPAGSAGGTVPRVQLWKSHSLQPMDATTMHNLAQLLQVSTGQADAEPELLPAVTDAPTPSTSSSSGLSSSPRTSPYASASSFHFGAASPDTDRISSRQGFNDPADVLGNPLFSGRAVDNSLRLQPSMSMPRRPAAATAASRRSLEVQRFHNPLFSGSPAAGGSARWQRNAADRPDEPLHSPGPIAEATMHEDDALDAQALAGVPMPLSYWQNLFRHRQPHTDTGQLSHQSGRRSAVYRHLRGRQQLRKQRVEDSTSKASSGDDASSSSSWSDADRQATAAQEHADDSWPGMRDLLTPGTTTHFADTSAALHRLVHTLRHRSGTAGTRQAQQGTTAQWEPGKGIPGPVCEGTDEAAQGVDASHVLMDEVGAYRPAPNTSSMNGMPAPPPLLSQMNFGGASFRKSVTFENPLRDVPKSPLILEHDERVMELRIIFDQEVAAEVCAKTPYIRYSSFFLLRARHPARIWLARLITSHLVQNFILLLIAGSSLILALDSPRLDNQSTFAQRLRMADTAFTALFTLEMVVKLIMKGCIAHPGAYLRNPWDIFDGVIVIASLVALLPASSQLSILRSLRLFRALRPLRMLTRWRGMQLVVETLIQSLPAVSHVILFGAFLFSVFAILGLQLFAGRMSHCNQVVVDGEPVDWMAQCVPGVFTCGADDFCVEGDTVERMWLRPFLNFDNLGNALLSLFTIATMDNYMDLARQLIDTVSENHQPRAKNAPWLGLYVLAFVFLGAWFWVNMLVSVIVEHYTQMVQDKGDVLASRKAKDWVKVFKFNAGKPEDVWAKVPVPSNRLRAMALSLIKHHRFDAAVMIVIIANALIMTLDHYDASSSFIALMNQLGVAFTLFFVVEMVLKMMALGLKRYWADNWNKLDAFIILVSIPDVLSSFVPQLHSLSFMTALKAFRVARMFKLVNKAKGLRTLFNTLIASLPAMFNVCSLLLLLMFIYTVLGMNIFGSTDRFDGQPILNFNNFGTSLLTLLRIFTGDDWSNVMALAFGCDDLKTRCDMVSGTSVFAGLFFPSFVLTAQFVMLNLVIAVILDNFIETAQDEGLFKTNNFVELLGMVISLRVFVKLMRLKVEHLKQRDARQRSTRRLARGLTSGRRDKSTDAASPSAPQPRPRPWGSKQGLGGAASLSGYSDTSQGQPGGLSPSEDGGTSAKLKQV